MNTTQPLNKILFLLDEISQAKNRINIATHVTRDIEIALLQAKVVALYGEIQQYNHLAMQPSAAPQNPVNNFQAAPIKQTYQAPANETYTAPKQETVIPEKPAPVAETPQQAPQPIVTEQKSVSPEPVQNQEIQKPEQPQAPRKDVTDFEKKREKLLREEEEHQTAQPKPAEQKLWGAKPVENKQPEQFQPRPQESKPAQVTFNEPVAETKLQPEPVQEKPIEPSPEPIQEPVSQPQPDIQKPEPQAAPEPVKPNVSQLYAQAREKAATSPGTEKSLNEKLATPQTSLNDRFQTHVKKNLADKLKLSPISDLRTAININQKVAFINQLFKGDDKEFKNVVSTVNAFKNFSEAKFYIQSDIAPRYNWNDNDDAVQEFMELVYRKFL